MNTLDRKIFRIRYFHTELAVSASLQVRCKRIQPVQHLPKARAFSRIVIKTEEAFLTHSRTTGICSLALYDNKTESRQHISRKNTRRSTGDEENEYIDREE